MIYADKALAQLLEKTEGRSNAAFVQTRAKYSLHSGASFTEVGGCYAMFDGVDSPLTQSFGLGLFEPIGESELQEIEDFFSTKKAQVFHEVSPLAQSSLMPLLNKRGYRPVEVSSVMFQALANKHRQPSLSKISTRIIQPGEENLWARTSGLGWASEGEDLSDFMLEFGLLNAKCPGGYPFMAELDAQPIATAMLFIFDDVALLAGASTIPTGRRLGAQSALLQARLQCAAQAGCKIAMMVALPGSQSQRNAEKNGFSLAYTRMKWQLAI